ncbi:MAG: hypothetical protein Q4C50_02405 [Eubacteriales bacterium]|nr:hypothetical protein [Eubacteriales bacterium]
MLRTLFKKQVWEMASFIYQDGRNGKRRSRAALVLYALLMVYIPCIFGWLFFEMAGSLCPALVQMKLGWLYFALMGLMATALGVIGSIFMTYSGLYQARDNELLLSMPIAPWKILLVRLSGIYAISFIFEATVLIPAVFAYAGTVGMSVLTIIFDIAIILLLPLFASALSCVLGWLLGIVAGHVSTRVKNILLVALSFVGILACYYFYFRVMESLQAILIQAGALGKNVKLFLYPLYQMGLAMQGNAAAFGCFALMVLAASGLVYAVLDRSFVKIVTAKRGETKTVYREKTLKAGTKTGALLRKEWLRYLGSPVYMMNCSMGTVFFLIAAVLVVFKGEWIGLAFTQFGIEEKNAMSLVICAAVCFIAAMNDLTAPSVSLEGKNIWIVQSLPVSAWQVLKAKLKLHILLTAIPALICIGAAEYVLWPGFGMGILIPAAVLLFIIFTALFGLAVNLKLPNLKWTNETAAVKQGIGVAVAMFGSWAVLLALGGICVLTVRLISAEYFLLLGALLLAAADILLIRWIKHRGTKIFAEL